MIKLKTPLSKGMLASTICVSIILLIALFISSTTIAGEWIAAVVIIPTFACCILLMPTSITIDDHSIYINRIMSRTQILKKDVIFIRPKASSNNDVRTFGSGGFFGYLGYFYAYKWGKYTAYVTDGNNMVAIETTKKKYVVSCENPQILIDCIKNRAVILE